MSSSIQEGLAAYAPAIEIVKLAIAWKDSTTQHRDSSSVIVSPLEHFLQSVDDWLQAGCEWPNV